MLCWKEGETGLKLYFLNYFKFIESLVVMWLTFFHNLKFYSLSIQLLDNKPVVKKSKFEESVWPSTRIQYILSSDKPQFI